MSGSTAPLQQPRTGTVTRIATRDDVAQSALGVVGCLSKIMAKQRQLESKLDRLTEILQAAAAVATTTERKEDP